MHVGEHCHISICVVALCCRLTSLIIKNTACWGCDDGVQLPQGFCSAMQNLQHADITLSSGRQQLAYNGREPTANQEMH